MINKKQYPLVLLKNVQHVFKEVRKIADGNRDVVTTATNDEFEILLKDIGAESSFNFRIWNPEYNNGKNTFNLKYHPRSEQRVDEITIGGDGDSVIVHLNSWIKLIRQYDTINLTPEEKILNTYEQEFFEDFEIIDEDAQVNPFNLEQQAALSNFLTFAIKLLDENKDENVDLISEATQLKDDLPRLTKKATVRKLSKLFAKIRQKGLPLLKQVLEEAKKELIKRSITGGFKMIGQFIETLASGT